LFQGIWLEELCGGTGLRSFSSVVQEAMGKIADKTRAASAKRMA
jgi:hypothetical protein